MLIKKKELTYKNNHLKTNLFFVVKIVKLLRNLISLLCVISK